MTKYQVLKKIAEYRIACKQDGVSIEDRPSSHRLVQGWNAIWILINRIKNGYYDEDDEDYEDYEDYDDDDPPDNLHNGHIIAHNLYKIDQDIQKDLTTSLSDLLDEATEENDFSIFSDMTPEQLGKRGWTWEVGKGMVRKPKPCCPHCHQELWWK
jgi:hypothetical protein